MAFDPKEHGFDDSFCRLDSRRNYTDEGLDFLQLRGRPENGALVVSMCADTKAEVLRVAGGGKVDFAFKGLDGSLALYAGTARKVCGDTRRGTVSIAPLRKVYTGLFGKFERIYLDMKLVDGAVVLTPKGGRE